MAREQLHVTDPLAQSRQLQPHDAQPIEEVLAEAPGAHFLLEVAIGSGDHPHVDLQRLDAADPLDLALLENAQELRLEVERELSQLVEEDGPAVRELEHALARRGRARERSLLVSEELALDQVLRDRAAVEDHEGAIAPA